jgi:hypothetical protein
MRAKPARQRVLRDICRGHVEESSYLLRRMKPIPEGDANLLDHTCTMYVHEHAEAHVHKRNGPGNSAGGRGRQNGNRHAHKVAQFDPRRIPDSRQEVLKTQIDFPTARKTLTEIV